MGIFDKIKNTIASEFGEETVRVMDVVDEPEEKVKSQEKPVKEKPIKAAKEPKGRKLLPRKKGNSEHDEVEEKEVLSSASPISPSSPNSHFYVDDDEESVFDTSEIVGDTFLKNQQAIFEREMNDNIPIPEPKDGKIADILEVLKIEPTFEIEADVFMPEDLKIVRFDQQAPLGYDFGQVDSFVSQTRRTVNRLVELLRKRNADVAKLATVIDKQQVIANNARYESEMANGINIMPTADTTELEVQLMDARSYSRKLEEKLALIEGGDKLNSSERKIFDDLQDELSIIRRDKEDLEEQVADLKLQIAQYEENKNDSYSSEQYPGDEVGLPSIFDGNSDTVDSEIELPDLVSDPEPKSYESKKEEFQSHFGKTNNGSVFELEDDEDDDIVERMSDFYNSSNPKIQIMDDSGNLSETKGNEFTYSSEENDNYVDFEKMIEDWNNK